MLYTDVTGKGIQMQLRVVKADGTTEEYLYTKVIGTISHALGSDEQPDLCVAEQLAEAVTYFLYSRKKPLLVSSSEILSVIKAVLSATGHEQAATVLAEHHFHRRLKRSRVEVLSVDVRKLSDAKLLGETPSVHATSQWDKSKIVRYCIEKHDVSFKTARAVASMVEDKIFKMGLTQVPVSLVKQLVLGDAAALLRAERQLLTV
jgi:transcriptional regulator NrdR family protein